LARVIVLEVRGLEYIKGIFGGTRKGPKELWSLREE